MGGTVTATGPGTAIELVVGSGAGNGFVNPIGSGALNLTGGGRWLVYSNDPANDSKGGLVYDFKQYNATYGVTLPAQATGNGFIYSIAPTPTAALAGPVSKVYDGTDIASLGAANYTVTGFDGDILVLNKPTVGSYDTKNVGVGKLVTVTGVALAGATSSVADGSVAVYGYQALASSTLTGNVGDINQASLTLSTSAVTKTYDGNLGALGTAKVVGGTLFAGDSLSGGTYSFTDKNVGTGKTVAVGAVTVSDGNGGANYAVSYANNTTSTITQRALSTWTGSAGDGLWSSPSNWDAIPDLANVQSVVIPGGAGQVQHNLAGTQVKNITVGAGSTLAVTGGDLSVATALTSASYSQSGGAYSGAGSVSVTSNFSMTGGSFSPGGNITINHGSGDLVLTGVTLESTGGSVNITTAGALSVVGGAQPAAIKAKTTMDLTVAGLNLTGTSTSASLISGNSMTINSNGPVMLTGGAGATAFALIDPTVSGDINISSTALTLQGGSGAGAYASILNPKGDIIMSVLSPPTLVSGFGGVGATATVVGNNINLASAPIVSNSVVTDAVVTFLEQFEVAVAEQAAEEEKRDAVAPSDIVVEGQVCK